MQDWLKPPILKQLSGFLGLTTYYLKFTMDYSIISRLLTNLLKKDALHCSSQASPAVEQLKEAITKTLLLALPDFTKPFIFETGGVLNH